jgi:hypothetical protein
MLEKIMRPQLKLMKYVDTELIAATRVFSFSIAEQHTCINLHIKRLDGRMCCVRKYLKKSFCICKRLMLHKLHSLALLRKMRSGEMILSILDFNISPQNHSFTFHPTTCLDVTVACLQTLCVLS